MRRRKPEHDGQTPVLLFIIFILLFFLLAYEGRQAEIELERITKPMEQRQ